MGDGMQNGWNPPLEPAPPVNNDRAECVRYDAVAGGVGGRKPQRSRMR